MKPHANIELVIPGFTDPSKQPAILKQLMEYARDMGYKDDEMQDIRDRRHLLMVYKAMVFDRLVHQDITGKK